MSVGGSTSAIRPLMRVDQILEDTEVTEIIFQTPGFITFEKKGRLMTVEETWHEKLGSRDELFSNIMESLPKAPSYEHPLASGVWGDFRVQVVSPPAITDTMLQLRRISSAESFQSFSSASWIVPEEVKDILIERFFIKKQNFMIAGPTGCGKTTLMKSLLFDFCKKDRVICIEDTPELPQVNSLSCNLNTYSSSSEEINDITLNDLVKASLRLRPDRLVMGEMRGAEASVFLLMLSTGHTGSGATIHAHNPQDALRRLEMLVQMGSPWKVQTVRSLIYSSLDIIITMGRNKNGARTILKISELEGLEDHGFLVNHIYENHEALPDEEPHIY